MSNIVLTRSVRENLLALQKTADLQSMTQHRLSTGKRVNSALDNPNSFFTAEGLNHRAGDLSNLQDALGQGIQTLRAAENGLEAISSLMEAAKAKVSQAFQTQSQYLRKSYVDDYNELLAQVEDLAEDSGYLGKNLLSGEANDLTIYFNEDNSSRMKIDAVDFSDASLKEGLNLSRLIEGEGDTGTVTLTGLTSLSEKLVTVAGGEYAIGDTVTFKDGNDHELGAIEITANTTVENFVNMLNGFGGISADFDGGTGDLTITSEISLTASSTNDLFNGGALGAPVSLDIVALVDSSFASESNIRSTLASVNSAMNVLRDQASTFGTNLTVVENRDGFIKDFINTLEIGAGMLILADSNEEGANLLALNTREQLSSTSLSFAAQADQNVLRLFG